MLVTNTVMSVGPCMGGHMNDVASDVAPFEVDAPSPAAGSAPWPKPVPRTSPWAPPCPTPPASAWRARAQSAAPDGIDVYFDKVGGGQDPHAPGLSPPATSGPSREVLRESPRRPSADSRTAPCSTTRPSAPTLPAADVGETLRAQRDIALMLSGAD